MSIENVLVDVDYKMVEELLVKDGFDVMEIADLYDEVGGSETYRRWVLLYSDDIIVEWYISYNGDFSNDHEWLTDLVAYTIRNYVNWIKTIN